MVIYVHFLGSLQKLLGASKFTLSCRENFLLKDAIKEMIIKNPKLEKLLNMEVGLPILNVLILVNGKEISILNGLKTILKNQDKLVFVPVTHGG